MITKINTQLDSLDVSLEQLLNKLIEEEHTVLEKKLSPERWSVYEVMQHLMLVESNSLRYLRKKSLGLNELKRAGLMTALRSWLLTLSMRSPLKFQTPKGVGVAVFTPVESFADLAGRWQKQREELRTFLNELPLEIFNKEVYRHPRGGMLSINGMLRFLQVHFDRHCLQIQRTLGEVKPR